MIWVGSFQSLRSALRKPPSDAPLKVHSWLRSETGLISPFADWLMSLIARSRCVRGKETLRSRCPLTLPFSTRFPRRCNPCNESTVSAES
jgi:hypothetical protein